MYVYSIGIVRGVYIWIDMCVCGRAARDHLRPRAHRPQIALRVCQAAHGKELDVDVYQYYMYRERGV